VIVRQFFSARKDIARLTEKDSIDRKWDSASIPVTSIDTKMRRLAQSFLGLSECQ
jgi:hypothetical protein